MIKSSKFFFANNFFKVKIAKKRFWIEIMTLDSKLMILHLVLH